MSNKGSFGRYGSVLLLLLNALCAKAQQGDVLQYVDPLIGTANGGHVFAGATLPFGMVKAVADVTGEDQGGFASDGSPIYGFSHMHDSGTGGKNYNSPRAIISPSDDIYLSDTLPRAMSPSLGNFPIFTSSNCPDGQIDNCIFGTYARAVNYKAGSVVATPGYFAVTLDTNIKAEMTVTNHTALYRFTYPKTPTEPNAPLNPVFLADLIDLPFSRSNASATVDPDTGRITGTGTFNPSFGQGSYDLHFCADFQGATVKDSGVYQNTRAGSEPKTINVYPDNVDNSPDQVPAGAYVQFNAPSTGKILTRVGMSFISVDQACGNGEREIPSFGFQNVRSSAAQAWRDKLNVVQLDATGVNNTILKTFWSGFYRTLISPQDYTGENPLWQSTEPYYDSYYCIWDSFRSIHPLITIVDPESQSRMVRSLIDIYEHEQWLPDCRMSLSKGFTQGGSNADVVLADAYLKNVTGIDWTKGYAAVVQDAEVEPPVWSIQGRGGLTSWKNLHYIPTDDFDPYGVGPFTRSISRTVEYAYNDFCIAEMAKGLGHMTDYEKYLGRSGYWQNMFDANQKSDGFTGFLQPKYLNGTFGFQDPLFCSPLLNFTSCYLNPDGHETYEGSSWLYTFFVPQDMASLITALGGPATFVRRLNYLHNQGILYIGDEQAFLPVYLYHYAGRPGLSASRIHTYIPSQFNASVGGIPGNDDSGAMGSFSTLAMMGLFPNPGQNVYLITPPFFPEVNITSKQTGKVASIKNINFDPNYNAIYIQSARLNGQNYTKNWIGHEFFLQGGVLELTLGMSESQWGTQAADLPPSLAPGS